MSKKKSPPSPEDQALFQSAMENVNPLKQERVMPFRKSKSPAEVMEREHESVKRDMLSDAVDFDEIEIGEGLMFSRPGLQHGVLRDLRRGRFAIQGELDLHRKTSDQARLAVQVFLREAQAHNKRCVRIIHGKGYGSVDKKPVLKGKVAKWLQQLDEVLAYCSARPQDGGSGALYVLLKKSGK